EAASAQSRRQREGDGACRNLRRVEGRDLAGRRRERGDNYPVRGEEWPARSKDRHGDSGDERGDCDGGAGQVGSDRVASQKGPANFVAGLFVLEASNTEAGS